MARRCALRQSAQRPQLPSPLVTSGHGQPRQVLALAHLRGAPACSAPQELLDKCHPLGMFDSIATLAVAQNMRELYRLVLVDTPLAPYFSENLTHEDLDEMNIEIMRNTLYKAYLDDFAAYCRKLGGTTAEIMGDMLAFEVGRPGARQRGRERGGPGVGAACCGLGREAGAPP
jgi:hypothetical protein